MTDLADPAELDRRKAHTVRLLKDELRPWIDNHSWPSVAVIGRDYPTPPCYSAVSRALLETAVERYMAVHGPDQAILSVDGRCQELAVLARKHS